MGSSPIQTVMENYPRLGTVRKLQSRMKVNCTKCNFSFRNAGSLKYVIDIEQDMFRGNDKVVYLCRTCYLKYKDNLLETFKP